MTNISIHLNNPRMLSGPSLTFIPSLAVEMGYAKSIVYLQLLYLATRKGIGRQPVRVSYSKMQLNYFPFFSRQWVIKTIQSLEASKDIKVHRTGRVNSIEVIRDVSEDCDDYFSNSKSVYKIKKALGMFQSSTSITEAVTEAQELTSRNAKMQISVELAAKVGVLEAIALQQVHLRHHERDGSHWVIKSYEEWQHGVLMFASLSTVKRLLAKLKSQKLIFTERYSGDFGQVNCYRVNYIRVAELLEIPVPTSVQPFGMKKKKFYPNSEKWQDQLCPIKPEKIVFCKKGGETSGL